MYTVLRRIHLFAGLIIFAFLMMYFITGYIIVHPDWFGRNAAKPEPTTQSASLAGYTGKREPRELAAHVAAQQQLRGRIRVPREQPDDAVRFSVMRPGTTHEINIPDDADTFTIKTSKENLAGTLIQMHRIHGYGHGWLFNLWVFFNDLASLSCILFALTGVYLWWKSTKNHLPGILCLTASCTYALAVILYLMYAR
jgi:hypothetical protein